MQVLLQSENAAQLCSGDIAHCLVPRGSCSQHPDLYTFSVELVINLPWPYPDCNQFEGRNGVLFLFSSHLSALSQPSVADPPTAGGNQRLLNWLAVKNRSLLLSQSFLLQTLPKSHMWAWKMVNRQCLSARSLQSSTGFRRRWYARHN